MSPLPLSFSTPGTLVSGVVPPYPKYRPCKGWRLRFDGVFGVSIQRCNLNAVDSDFCDIHHLYDLFQE